MNNKLNKFLVCVLMGIAAFLIIVAGKMYKGRMQRNAAASLYDFAMGTSIKVTVYDTDKPGEANTIVDLIKDTDNQYISWRSSESEVTAVNKALEAGDSITLSSELSEAVNESLKVCKDSEGALDITLRPLLDCWGIEEADSNSFTIPGDEDIENALSKTGYEKLHMDGDSIFADDKEISIDLGSTGKGYALDLVRKKLAENSINASIVSIGGSVIVYGVKPDGHSWKVGIRDPFGDQDDMMGYLEMKLSEDDYICVSTSGNYEKYIEKDGKRYHHIMDRSTGAPAETGLSSVTVICKSGIDSDALSTACFVLGEEKSTALLAKYDAEAVFIDLDGNVRMTEGAKKMYHSGS